jgi:hypothetical protein
MEEAEEADRLYLLSKNVDDAHHLIDDTHHVLCACFFYQMESFSECGRLF